jgi:hypothetical protein
MIFIQAGGACLSYFICKDVIEPHHCAPLLTTALYKIVLGDTMPILLDSFVPHFDLVSTRTFVICFIGIVFVSSFRYQQRK